MLEVYEEEFDQIVLESNIPVIVDFWADWCTPCKRMLPLLEKIADEYEGAVLIVKVNIEDNPGLAEDFEIASIPCFISFRDGQVYKSMLGTGSIEQLLDLVDLEKDF